MSAKIDLTGHIFGRLTVVKDTGKRQNKKVVWLCQCSCGGSVEVITGNLKTGNTQSCGCLFREGNSKVHGHAGHVDGQSRTYTAWCNMKRRCLNHNHPRYTDWGGRGIEVCNQWLYFENFLEDMGECPGDMSLDRIDNDGHYCPENCRWTTPDQQNRNRWCCVL